MSGLEERPQVETEPAGHPGPPKGGPLDVATEPAGHPGPPKGGPLDVATVEQYLALFDFTRQPSSKAAWLVRLAAIGIALFLLWKRVDVATSPLLSAKPPNPIPSEEIDDYRFRLPERTRREIFAEIATAELAERARAISANTWNGHQWSREDDRGHHERVALRSIATRHRISLSQAYLILDEGLRAQWLAPDGKPLPATTPPLSMRSNSW